MKHISSIGWLVAALSLSGCATQFGALFNGSQAGVSATVRTDPRLATAASVLASGAAIAANSQLDAQAEVHTPGINLQRSSGSAFEVAAARPAATATPAGGATVTASADGSSVTTSTTTVTTTGATSTPAASGSAALGARTIGTAIGGGAGNARASTTTTTTVSIGVVTHVAIDVVETQTPGEVFSGGDITLRNAPNVTGLRVLQGSLAVHANGGVSVGATGAGSTTTHARGDGSFSVQSGIVLLGAPDGRRWRVRVDGGALRVATEGTNPSGRTVFVPGEGSLDVSVIAEGGADLSLAVSPSAPSGSVAMGAGTHATALNARTVDALNRLLSAVPANSPESLRLASAVEFVMDHAQTANPAFYDVPVVGRSLVLVVDVSYSMGDIDTGATDLAMGRRAQPRKLDVARAELIKVLASIPSGVTVSVVAFSSGVQTLWAAPRAIDDASLNEAIEWVANLRPQDETEPVAALQTALGMNPEQIVLLSDGRPSYRAPVAQAVMSLTARFSASTRLDVVGIGPDQDTELLTALATRGHGTLRQR